MTIPENPYASPTHVQPPLSIAEEKQWAILTHVLGIFFGAVSAIALWILYRNRGPFIRAHTTTEFNFQLTVLAASMIAMFVSFGSVFFSIANADGSGSDIGLFFVGYFGVIVVRLVAAILGIVAAIAANKGQVYRYPVAFPFAKAN